MGLRLRQLGTEALTWRDLLVIIRRLPATSALASEVAGERAQWGLTEHLLAVLIDAVQHGNWQRAGNKNAQHPKPIPRPGATDGTTRYGKDAIAVKDFDAWWDS